MPQVPRPRPIPGHVRPPQLSPPPPALPVAAEEDAEARPMLPRMMTRIKPLLARAVNGVFGGMNRAWGVALLGFHAFVCVVKIASFTTDPELARFWLRIFRAWVYLGVAAILLMLCVRIYYCLFGVDAVEDDLLKHELAAVAAERLPPPPPQMDMC